MLDSTKEASPWEWKELEEVSDLISGRHIKKDNYNKDGEGIPYLTGPSDFGDEFPIISKYTNHPEAKAKADDVLITVKGAGVGKTNILDIEDAAISRQLKAIRSDILNSKFLFYFLKSHYNYFQQLGEGSTVPGLNNEQILETEVPVPPHNKQLEIVDSIEGFISKLNKSMDSLSEAETNLENYSKAFLRDSFNGKTTSEWRNSQTESLDPAPHLLGELPSESDNSDYPSSWCLTTLGEIAEVIPGNSPPSTSYNEDGEGVPLINGPDEFGPNPFSKTKQTKYTTEPTKMCNKGDLILCVRGSTLGRMNISACESAIGRGVAALRADFNQKYINYYIHYKRNDIYQMGSGSTFPSVSSGDLRGIEIPLPPLSEQEKIVEQLENKFSIIESTEKEVNNGKRRTKRLRESILRKAFTGEITGTELNDESSSDRSASKPKQLQLSDIQ